MLKCTIREATPDDYESIVDYFHNASDDYMKNLGADPKKLPSKKEWIDKLLTNHERTVQEKRVSFLIWELDGKPIGHGNINKITFGKYAYFHLHLWNEDQRKQGLGTQFIKLSIPYFFTTFDIKKLYSEPYSKNKAPNYALPAVGFEFLDSYTTKPGSINFKQEVNRYIFIKAQLKKLIPKVKI